MKRKGWIILMTICFSVLMGSCTKNSSVNNSVANSNLKGAINQNALNLNNAVNAISSSKVYSILTYSGGVQKSLAAETAYKVYITLDTVKGVYDYKPVQTTHRWNNSLMKFFTKTSD